MKKKLLSLVLAGAMVASTSVSAFADTVTTDGGDANVEITGEVVSDSGVKPVGTLRVSIPTAATFMVTETGLEGTKIRVTNEGDKNVDIFAERFVDPTKEEGDGITVGSENNLESKGKTYVSLRLQGKFGNVYLKTEEDGSNNKGLYKKMDLIEPATDDALKLTSLTPGESEELKLEGKAGKKRSADGDQFKVENPVSNNFTLTLKIKKSVN